jgi:hypothetical protein
MSSDYRTKSLSFENVVKFKHMGMMVNKKCILEEINNRLNSGNVCYHAVQNLLSPCLLSRSVKIKIYKTITLPVICMRVKLGLSH